MVNRQNQMQPFASRSSHFTATAAASGLAETAFDGRNDKNPTSPTRGKPGSGWWVRRFWTREQWQSKMSPSLFLYLRRPCCLLLILDIVRGRENSEGSDRSFPPISRWCGVDNSNSRAVERERETERSRRRDRHYSFLSPSLPELISRHFSSEFSLVFPLFFWVRVIIGVRDFAGAAFPLCGFTIFSNFIFPP